VKNKPIIILTSVPSKEVGQSIGLSLIEKNLAACVNILPDGVSIYKWEDTLHNEKEHQLLIKTIKNKELEIYNHIKDNHPYKVPEILTISLDNGEEAYLKWIESSII